MSNIHTPAPNDGELSSIYLPSELRDWYNYLKLQDSPAPPVKEIPLNALLQEFYRQSYISEVVPVGHSGIEQVQRCLNLLDDTLHSLQSLHILIPDSTYVTEDAAYRWHHNSMYWQVTYPSQVRGLKPQYNMAHWGLTPVSGEPAVYENKVLILPEANLGLYVQEKLHLDRPFFASSNPNNTIEMEVLGVEPVFMFMNIDKGRQESAKLLYQASEDFSASTVFYNFPIPLDLGWQDAVDQYVNGPLGRYKEGVI